MSRGKINPKDVPRQGVRSEDFLPRKKVNVMTIEQIRDELREKKRRERERKERLRKPRKKHKPQPDGVWHGGKARV